ncbi:MAG: polysaccharide biosynthesis C-terminal domain-containing protein, partial [Candidatus Omnitrophica bacterium]|nr:polysaccharide biosynthesis C-terminal domain-containing protein [Candidatus Omnitrophota bacterium]
IKEMARLFLPRTLGVAIYQINLFVDTIFASLALIVGEGAPAALAYAQRIIQLPMALFVIALAQVALPTMSGLAHRHDLAGLKQTLFFSLRSVFTLMIPVTAGLLVLARPLVKLVFERGSFSSYSTEITASCLFFYCLGLIGYAGVKILASCFYSLKDTSTPGKVAGLALIINVALNLILMRPMQMAGLALATAVSVTVNFLLLLAMLRKRIGEFGQLGKSFLRLASAALIMGLLLWFIFYRSGLLPGNDLMLAVKLVASILLAIFIYWSLLRIFAQEEARILRQWVFKKK